MKNTKNRTKLIIAQIKVNELSVLLLTNPVVLSVFPTPELSIIFITIDDIKEIVPATLVILLLNTILLKDFYLLFFSFSETRVNLKSSRLGRNFLE